MGGNVQLGKSTWGGLTRFARALRPDPSDSIGVIGGHTLEDDDEDEVEVLEDLEHKQD